MSSVYRMLKRAALGLSLTLATSFSYAAPSLDTIEETLANVAADSNEGRTIGSEGHTAAKDWLIAKLESVGVVGAGTVGFEQQFTALPRPSSENDSVKSLTNIVGILYPEGESSGAPEVMLSAHYDGISDDWHPGHEGTVGNCAVMPDSLEIGFSDVCNAAADNVTGIGAIIAVLEDIRSKIKAPVAVIFFDGEEDSTVESYIDGQQGLIGSGYFARFPSFDTSKLKLHINLETIGIDLFPGLEDQVFAIGAHSGGTDLKFDVNRAAQGVDLTLDHAHAGLAQGRTDMNSFMLTQSVWQVPFIVFTNGPGSIYHTNFDQYLPDFNHLKNPINMEKTLNIAKVVANLTVDVTEKSNAYTFSKTKVHNLLGNKIIHIDFSMHSLMVDVLDRVIVSLNTQYTPDQLAYDEIIEIRGRLSRDSRNFFLKLFWGPLNFSGLVSRMQQIFDESRLRTARYIRTYGIVL